MDLNHGNAFAALEFTCDQQIQLKTHLYRVKENSISSPHEQLFFPKYKMIMRVW